MRNASYFTSKAIDSPLKGQESGEEAAHRGMFRSSWKLPAAWLRGLPSLRILGLPGKREIPKCKEFWIYFYFAR
jgi:hypothetical protein